MRSCVVTGAYSRPSRTHGIGRQLALRFAPEADHDEIELVDFAAHLVDPWGDPEAARLRDRVRAADLLVIGSPTMKASYSGLLKLFLDGFGAHELAGVPTAVVMTGAAAEHALTVEYQLRPVLGEIGCSMPAPGLYLWGEQLDAPAPHVARWAAGANLAPRTPR